MPFAFQRLACLALLCAAPSVLCAQCPSATYPAPYTAYAGYCRLQSDFNGNGVAEIVFVGGAEVFTHVDGNPDPAARKHALHFATGTYQGYGVGLLDQSGDGVPDLLFTGAPGTFRFNGLPDGTFASTAIPPPPPKKLVCSTITALYGGSKDLTCPAEMIAVTASCDNGYGVVIHDQSTPPIPGTATRVWYLTPNASASTGVHCLQVGTAQSVAMLRCCKI